MNNQPWYNVALQIWGAIMLGAPLFLWLFNKGRKQANANISKTESEVYKQIIENKLMEVNITEVIEKKVEAEIQPLKEMLWNSEKEHYEIKLEMQERLKKTVEEKIIIEKENEMLRNELSIIRQEHESTQRALEQLKKDFNLFKQQQHGKS